MPARVMLSITEGPLRGTKYRFDERMVCIVGRAENCTLRIPSDGAEGVSRHHCMLDIDPPSASIQDLGSRFGTFVNGENIGPSQRAPNAQLLPRSLRNGDSFVIGNLKFHVELSPGMRCSSCLSEIAEPDEAKSLQPDGAALCPKCAAKRQARNPLGERLKASAAARTSKIVRCASCGVEAGGDATLVAGQRYLCPRCRAARGGMETVQLSISDIEEMPSNLLGIDGFKAIKQIGRGGMGAVYLAREIASGELVALKIMLPGVAVDEKAREEFLREASNCVQLKHPNIVAAHSAGYSGGALYIALEYCPGGNLKNAMAAKGEPLPVEQACDIALKMLDALDYAHNLKLPSVKLSGGSEGSAIGLVHRDVKPENVFVSGEWPAFTPKIADFGLAKSFAMAGLSGCTMTGDFSGSLGFIPRQQLMNFKYVKPEVDVWATAATLYWMLTLKPPRNFAGASPFDALLATSPVKLRERDPEAPLWLAKLLDEALDDSSSLKYKTAARFRADLLKAMAK